MNKITIPEDSIHRSVVSWFDMQYPKLKELLIHVPNGGKREQKTYKDKTGKVKSYSPEAKNLKRMGTRAGASDLLLLIPRQGFGSLAIEMKTETGLQSKEQKLWAIKMLAAGNKYIICRSLNEAMKEINNYLNT